MIIKECKIRCKKCQPFRQKPGTPVGRRGLAKNIMTHHGTLARLLLGWMKWKLRFLRMHLKRRQQMRTWVMKRLLLTQKLMLMLSLRRTWVILRSPLRRKTKTWTNKSLHNVIFMLMM